MRSFAFELSRPGRLNSLERALTADEVAAKATTATTSQASRTILRWARTHAVNALIRSPSESPLRPRTLQQHRRRGARPSSTARGCRSREISRSVAMSRWLAAARSSNLRYLWASHVRYIGVVLARMSSRTSRGSRSSPACGDPSLRWWPTPTRKSSSSEQLVLIGGRSPQAHPHVGRGRRARPFARRQTCDSHPRARSAAHGERLVRGSARAFAAPTERGALRGDLVTKVDRPEDGFLSTFRYQEPSR